jgi:hypothetical protein
MEFMEYHKIQIQKTNYIVVFGINYYLNYYCDKCGNKYENIFARRCNLCQINYLKNNFPNWTSGNEKIDSFIQKMQLKYNVGNTVFEWIPYNKFIIINRVEEKGGFSTALWKDGPLSYNGGKKEWKRDLYQKVCLKYLRNSQHITDEFLNEVRYLNFY